MNKNWKYKTQTWSLCWLVLVVIIWVWVWVSLSESCWVSDTSQNLSVEPVDSIRFDCILSFGIFWNIWIWTFGTWEIGNVEMHGYFRLDDFEVVGWLSHYLTLIQDYAFDFQFDMVDIDDYDVDDDNLVFCLLWTRNLVLCHYHLHVNVNQNSLKGSSISCILAWNFSSATSRYVSGFWIRILMFGSDISTALLGHKPLERLASLRAGAHSHTLCPPWTKSESESKHYCLIRLTASIEVVEIWYMKLHHPNQLIILRCHSILLLRDETLAVAVTISTNTMEMGTLVPSRKLVLEMVTQSPFFWGCRKKKNKNWRYPYLSQNPSTWITQTSKTNQTSLILRSWGNHSLITCIQHERQIISYLRFSRMDNKAGFNGIVATQCSGSTFNGSLSSNGSLEIWIRNGQMDWVME